jgi:hypothetical protein
MIWWRASLATLGLVIVLVALVWFHKSIAAFLKTLSMRAEKK